MNSEDICCHSIAIESENFLPVAKFKNARNDRIIWKQKYTKNISYPKWTISEYREKL